MSHNFYDMHCATKVMSHNLCDIKFVTCHTWKTFSDILHLAFNIGISLNLDWIGVFFLHRFWIGWFWINFGVKFYNSLINILNSSVLPSYNSSIIFLIVASRTSEKTSLILNPLLIIQTSPTVWPWKNQKFWKIKNFL